MNHDTGIGQSKTLALGTGSQEERSHTGRHPDTNRAHIRFDELHCVVNTHTGVDTTTGTVDVKRNIFFRIFTF